MTREDVEKVVEIARGLDIKPRADRWCHLSLCVIDAVFSIGANYGSTWRAARRYADHANLQPVTAPASSVAAGDYAHSEQSLDQFRTEIAELSDDEFADLLANRQRTSTRSGILKALAVRQYVDVLAQRQLKTLDDVSTLLGDRSRLKEIESELARVRGHGSGARLAYLWMLAGDDQNVKADRMVIAWTSQVLNRPVSAADAAKLIIAAAGPLNATPWELDHAIWRRQSGRSASAST